MTHKKVKNITERHKINKEALLFSTWELSREVVNTYNVEYRIYYGLLGGTNYIDFDNMDLDYNPYFRMYYTNTN
jgi:hypothetical protein